MGVLVLDIKDSIDLYLPTTPPFNFGLLIVPISRLNLSLLKLIPCCLL